MRPFELNHYLVYYSKDIHHMDNYSISLNKEVNYNYKPNEIRIVVIQLLKQFN